MNYNNLIYETDGPVATCTFNRPKALNALNTETMDEFSHVISKVRDDRSLKVLILTGAGDRAFIAGADIKCMAGRTPLEARWLSAHGSEILRNLETIEKPSIAAVNGFALGGGCEVAMACSIRLASTNAQFGQPEINLGIIPGYGATQRLPRLVGAGRALELLMTGDSISAAEAFRIGLVNRVCEPDALMDEARALAHKLASKSRSAIEFILGAVHGGLEAGLEAGLALETEKFGLVNSTEDSQEGLRAFIEKTNRQLSGPLTPYRQAFALAGGRDEEKQK